MKKADLVDAIASRANVSKVQAQTIVEDVFELISDGLARGEQIDLRGFGTFKAKDKKARTGRNPRTGEPIPIPGGRVPTFKPGKELKDRVNTSAAAAKA